MKDCIVYRRSSGTFTARLLTLCLMVPFLALSMTAFAQQRGTERWEGQRGTEQRQVQRGSEDRPGERPATTRRADPEPETTAADPLTTPPIDFSMNNADVNAVIQFITKHTGKPVMRERSVSVRLTLSAPEKIPPYRALDLIYDTLLMEGFSVIETEDLIRVVPVAETSRFDMLTITGPLPEDLRLRKARILRQIIDLRNIRPEQAKEQLDPLLGPHASIATDDRTNRIMVTDTVRNLERFESILRELDIPGFDDMDVQVVQLEHADAQALADMLMQALVATGAAIPQRGRGPQAQQIREGSTIILPDTRTNSLIITSPIERMNSIIDFARRLDVPKPKDLEVQVVPIHFADPPAVASAITEVFRRIAGRSFQDTVEVRPTGRDNALLVLASEDNFRLIMEIVEALDTEEAMKRETRRYELKYLDAEDTAQELEQLYTTTQRRQQPSPFIFYSPWGQQQQQDEVTFVPITRTNSLLIVAPPSEFRLIEELIAEIDQPIDVEDVLPKIYRLRYVQAADAVEVLNDVFGIQQTQQTSPFVAWWQTSQDTGSMVGRLTGKMKFTADENTNSIIAITNNRSNYEVVDRMIEQLDQMFPELANTMIVPLEHANSAHLVNVLNSLFGRPARPEGGGNGDNDDAQPFTYWWGADSARATDSRPISNLIEQVRFVADARTNSVLVTTAAQNFEIIRNIIKDLDKEEPQVLISVRVVEVNRGRDRRTGIRWTPDPSIFSPEDMDGSIRVLQGLDFIDTFGGWSTREPGVMQATRSGLRGQGFTQSFDGRRGIISSTVNMDLLIQMLLKNFDSEMVISPTLYVSNNQEGHVFVGQNIPRLTGSQFTPEGTRNDTFENEDVGVDMTITPNISKNGQVVLKVNLNTSQTTGETRFGSDVIQKREYNTQVAVHGGETVVLGGIRLTNDLEIVRKVPILGDILLVGSLFRHRISDEGVTDLYAFITPEIVESPERAAELRMQLENSIGAPREPVIQQE